MSNIWMSDREGGMHRRWASEHERRQAHKKANRARNATFQDLPGVIADVVAGTGLDLDGLVEQQIHAHYHGGVDEKKFAEAIFDPALTRLQDLAPGLLDQKEEVLPPGMIPTSMADLRTCCERLVLVSDERCDLLDLIAEGWPTIGRSDPLGTHVLKLHELSRRDVSLYRAIVSGRHREVVFALRSLRTGNPAQYAELFNLLIVQALLWCAHDVQMVMARLAHAANPFGDLLASTYVTLDPGRVRNLARARRLLLEQVVDVYFGRTDWRVADVESMPGPRRTIDLEKDPVVAQLRDRVVDAGFFLGHRIGDKGLEVGAWMTSVARALRDNDAYILELATPDAAVRLDRNFSQVWFTGLSPVTAAAVTVLRYVQAEQQIRELIEEIVPVEGVRPVPRLGTALRASRKTDLKRGSIERARALLAGYRDAILNDRDHTGAEASGGAGEQVIGKAAKFLEALGERRIADHQGDRASTRRSYYLLDVVPEHRLGL